MPILRIAGLAFLRFVLVYTIFLLPWLGLSSGFATVYRDVGEWLFQSAGAPDYAVRFQADESSAGTDTRLILINVTLDNLNQAIPPQKMGGLSSRSGGYTQLTFFIALVLAAPITWRRRGLALLIGGSVLLIFIWLKLLLTGKLILSMYQPMHLISISPLMSQFLTTFKYIFVENVGINFVIPLVLAVILCVNGDDWQRFSKMMGIAR